MIKLLPESLIGKIAAGEVVERPAAAIKELVENSLDAGASAVTVEIRDGGLTHMRVTDNGSGIAPSDIRMAFERHATSKIAREQDLYSIATLGFRGEALASIAAVSRVTLTTRTAGEESGLKVVNEGGKIISVSEAACPPGTTVVVADLFYNTPVRRGFMKKASAEGAAVTDLISQLILSRPDVSFRLIHDEKTLYHSPGDGQLSSAVHTVFGGQALKTMRLVNDHMNGVLLDGYVGIGENARGNRSHEMFFINGRMMHSPVLSAALETACRERVMIGRFPICALHLRLPYEAVDVNVHPNKLEVRFRDEKAVAEAVTTLVLEALKDRDAFENPVALSPAGPPAHDVRSAYTIPKSEGAAAPIDRQILKENAAQVTVIPTLPPPVPEGSRDAPKPTAHVPEGMQGMTGTIGDQGTTGNERVQRTIGEKPVQAAPQTVPHENHPPQTNLTEEVNGATGDNPAQAALRTAPPEQLNTILPEIRKDMKIFGALFRTYILIEYEDRLLLVDQHAVHERLLFDRLMSEHAGKCAAQELLVPLVISLTGKEYALIDEHRNMLESIGLVIDRFGEQEGAVRSVPVILGESETVPFIRDVLADLEAGRGMTFERQRAALLQTACKHAVKGGEELTEDQLRNLVEEMIEKKVTPTCPHGRPLVVAVTHRELDRKFRRIQ